MKKCSYCGKEYGDDVAACVIDGQPLLDTNTPPVSPTEPAPVEAQRVTKEPPLTYPDYQWRAVDAWKCLGMILVFEFVTTIIVSASRLHYPAFGHWFRTPVGNLLSRVQLFSIWTLSAVYFARTETFASVRRAFALDVKPSDLVWFGLVVALVIRASGHNMIAHGWGQGVSSYSWTEFRHTQGPLRYLYLVSPILFAPVFEEIVNRGFLFKAFRGSYPFVVSTALILGWVAYTHWSQFSHSWIAVVDLSVLTVVQCYLREKSNSLWDCILCHFAYNASTLFLLRNVL